MNTVRRPATTNSRFIRHSGRQVKLCINITIKY